MEISTWHPLRVQITPSYINSDSSAYLNSSSGICNIPPANATFLNNVSDNATGQVSLSAISIATSSHNNYWSLIPLLRSQCFQTVFASAVLCAGNAERLSKCACCNSGKDLAQSGHPVKMLKRELSLLFEVSDVLQIPWLKSCLQSSNATWDVIVGHFALYGSDVNWAMNSSKSAYPGNCGGFGSVSIFAAESTYNLDIVIKAALCGIYQACDGVKLISIPMRAKWSLKVGVLAASKSDSGIWCASLLQRTWPYTNTCCATPISRQLSFSALMCCPFSSAPCTWMQSITFLQLRGLWLQASATSYSHVRNCVAVPGPNG